MPPTRHLNSTSACSACIANCTVPRPHRRARSRCRRPARQNGQVPPSVDEPAADDAARLDAIAVELYALPPDDFTSARNARAAAADRSLAARVKTLRKPTAAAWAVDLLARDGQLA